jgi:hypothetical protein
VTSRLCSRCHSVLHVEDEGTLVFCSACGAPQVQLSEDLRDQIEKQIAGQETAASAFSAAPPPTADAINWTGAIQLAGLAGAVAAAFSLLSFVVPPIAALSFLWLIGAPIVILGIYAARFRKSRITTSFGARLGLLCGLAIVLCTITLNTVGLLLQRYVFHTSTAFDNVIANLFVQMQSQWETQMRANNTPDAASMIASIHHMLSIPEFRAGFVLLGTALLLVFYLAFATATGAFAGYFRSRTSASHQSSPH